MKPLLIGVLTLFATAAFAAVVQPVGSAPAVLIPAAGSTAGLNSFYRSDITVINLGVRDQPVRLQWLPLAGSGIPTSATINIPAHGQIRQADFVRDYMNQSGLGAILMTGVTSTGSFDSSARLFVSSRIWTPMPNGAPGVTSQSFPAIPVSAIETGIATLYALGGADNPGNYRVNVGVVNLDSKNVQHFVVTVAISIFPQPTYIFDLPPLTMTLISLGSGLDPLTQVNIQNTTPAATRSNQWIAFGSTVENNTNDAWSEIAVAASAP
jgi:hypothetical protein